LAKEFGNVRLFQGILQIASYPSNIADKRSQTVNSWLCTTRHICNRRKQNLSHIECNFEEKSLQC